MKKRLGIFLIFAENNSLDDYVLYLAKEIKKCVNNLFIVCNGFISSQIIKNLHNITQNIFIRDNVGYDCGAYKDALENFIGWKNVLEYDELLLMNDSCFGPLYSLSDVFQTMDSKHVDFWGMTEQLPVKRNHYSNEQYPYHIQSYFLVIRNRMLKSKEFYNFWRELKLSNHYDEVVENFELRFTTYFHEFGYKSDVYIDSSCFGQGETENQAYVFYDSFKLIAQQRCPFIKKKVFLMPHDIVLSTSSGEIARRVFEYIRNYTEYDINLIWDYLLSKCNVSDIKTTLHLDYVVDENKLERKPDLKINKKIAIIVHLSYTDLIEHCLQYIDRFSEKIDVYISTKGKNNINIINQWIVQKEKTNCKVVIPKDRGREISALLIACKDILMKYDYLCFVHDKKKNSGVPYQTVGQSFMDILWDNCIKSMTYIENIIYVFEKEPRLGLLAPPIPYMSYYFMVGSLGWTGNYNKTEELAKRLHLKCNISPDKQPFVLGTTFWCRPQALKALFEAKIEYEDFDPEPMAMDNTISHAIERILPYVAQSEGYASGIIMCKEYASLYITNYQFMLNKIIQNVLLKQGVQLLTDVSSVNPEIYNFCNSHKKVYIYGAGAMGQSCYRMLKEHDIWIEGFVVSDGHKSQNIYINKPIYEFSELCADDSLGIILALNKKNMDEVIYTLKSRNKIDYILYTE